MWDREDSQEVGLEAAEWLCADNVVGLKYIAEAAELNTVVLGW